MGNDTLDRTVLNQHAGQCLWVNHAGITAAYNNPYIFMAMGL
jgi:hypothetical protein